MMDNFTANAGSGGDTFAADDISGVKYPRSKVGFGEDGVYVDVDAINRLPVDTGANVSNGSSSIQGQSAHDEPITSSPVRTAARAATSNFAAVQNGDAVDVVATVVGSQIMKPFSIPEADWQYAADAGGIINALDVLVRPASTGLRSYITGITLQNVSSTIATEFVLKNGSTVIWRGILGIASALTSGVNIQFQTPLKTSVNTALNIACITTGAAVYANLQGYTAP